MATPTKKQLMNPNIMDSGKFTDKEIMDGLIKHKLIDPKDFYSKKKTKDTGNKVARKVGTMKDPTKKIRNPESKFAAKKGGMAMPMHGKKKSKMMARGGMKKSKMMAKGGMKKSKMMARGGMKKSKMMARGGMKKTKSYARGGAARRR